MDTPIFKEMTNGTPEPVEPAPPVTVDVHGGPTAAPTAKVLAGAVAGVILTGVVAALTAITPDLFAALGPWTGVVFAGVTAIGSALAAYIKRPSEQAR